MPAYQAYQLSGITSVPTGLYPVTGTPSGFTGPWLIETQSLNIEYVRVPGSMTVDTSNVTSLSAVSVRSATVRSTVLSYRVTASYSRVKSYESFSTSAFLQNQKFSVVASPDVFGETYGPSSALSGTVLGPAGSIITYQPYIRRVAWDDSIHTEVSKNVRGSNIMFGRFNESNQLTDCDSANLMENMTSFKHAIDPRRGHTYLNDSDARIIGAQYPNYWINGTYALSKEESWRFVQLVNYIGNNIRSGFGLFKLDPIVGTDVVSNYPGSPNIYDSASVQIAEYNSNRHDFT